MKKKNQQFVNYLLTIGFIFLVVLFLTSIVFISRGVLSNPQFINSSVKDLKPNILENINEVETLTKITKNNTLNLPLNKVDFDFFKIQSNDFSLNDSFFLNINKNKSIISFRINGEIGSIGNRIFYKKIKNSSNILKKDIVVYSKSRIGQVLSVNKDLEIKVLNLDTNKIEITNSSLIEGRVFLRVKND